MGWTADAGAGVAQRTCTRARARVMVENPPGVSRACAYRGENLVTPSGASAKQGKATVGYRRLNKRRRGRLWMHSQAAA